MLVGTAVLAGCGGSDAVMDPDAGMVPAEDTGRYQPDTGTLAFLKNL